MNQLCGTQTLMIIFMRNECSIRPKIEISYQFHMPAIRFGKAGLTINKQIKNKQMKHVD